jgi:hypothetical protein
MPEYESVAEMVSDCAEIPLQLRACERTVPEPRASRPWAVNERCLAAVHGLDDYV